MAELDACILPDDLAYHVEYNVWVRDNGDGTCDLGMTDIAQSLAGALLHCRPKPAGKTVAEGKSLATVESGKWVGPVKAPFDCAVVAVNKAIESDATVMNRSPYRAGWIVRVKPTAGAAALAGLARGQAAVDGFRDYMARNKLAACIHCEGFDGE
jgi:glycine cleavage system H protein